MPDEHALFAPSAADRWLNCPRAVRPHEPQPPETSNIYSERGTAMHEAAERILKGDDSLWGKPITFEFEGKQHTLTPEEWEAHVRPYVEHVRGIKGKLLVEQKVQIYPPGVWGTADAVVIDEPNHAWLIDLKTGSHVVDPGCDQFMTYAVGLAHEHGLEWITLSRSQIASKLMPWDTYTADADEIAEHRQRIEAAVKAAYGAKPGEECMGDWCQWCPYRLPDCPAHTKHAVACLPDDLDPAPAKLALPKAKDLTEDKRSFLLWHGKAIIKWIEDCLKYEREEAVKTGQAPEGFKLVEANTKRKWNPELSGEEIAAAITEAAALVDAEVDPWKPREVVSFTTIEKLLGDGFVGHLTIKPEGAPTLAPDTDNRPQIGGPLHALEDL